MEPISHLGEADKWLGEAEDKIKDNEWEAVAALSALASAHAATAQAGILMGNPRGRDHTGGE
jgi:hypothetical protein